MLCLQESATRPEERAGMTALTYDERQDLVTAVYRAESAANGASSDIRYGAALLDLLFHLPDQALRDRAARLAAADSEERGRERALRLR